MDIKLFLNEVCEAMNVDRNSALSSNREECVDARAVAFTILSERYGMSDSYIARNTGVTRQCVNKLRNSMKYRRNKWEVRSAMKMLNS